MQTIFGEFRHSRPCCVHSAPLGNCQGGRGCKKRLVWSGMSGRRGEGFCLSRSVARPVGLVWTLSRPCAEVCIGDSVLGTPNLCAIQLAQRLERGSLLVAGRVERAEVFFSSLGSCLGSSVWFWRFPSQSCRCHVFLLCTHVLCYFCSTSPCLICQCVFVAVDDEGETNGCAENEVQFLIFPKLCVFFSVLVS